MGTLTTVDNVQYYFDPDSIAAISDYDPAGGGAVTCVYGISASYLMIAETPQAFMSDVGIAAKLVKLDPSRRYRHVGQWVVCRLDSFSGCKRRTWRQCAHFLFIDAEPGRQRSRSRCRCAFEAL